MISLSRPTSKQGISKPESKTTIQNKYSKTHMDNASYLSKSKQRVGIIKSEQQIPDSLSSVRSSDLIDEKELLSDNPSIIANAKRKNEQIKPSVPKIPLRKPVQEKGGASSLHSNGQQHSSVSVSLNLDEKIEDSKLVESKIPQEKAPEEKISKKPLPRYAQPTKSAEIKKPIQKVIDEKGAMKMIGSPQQKPPEKLSAGKTSEKPTLSKPAIRKGGKLEEKKVPEIDGKQNAKSKLADVIQQLMENKNWMNVIQNNYNPIVNAFEQRQVQFFLVQLRNEHKKGDLLNKLEGVSQVVAKLQQPMYEKLVNFLRTDRHHSLQKLRNCIYENLHNILAYLRFAIEQFRESSEQRLYETFTSLANTVPFTEGQVRKLCALCDLLIMKLSLAKKKGPEPRTQTMPMSKKNLGPQAKQEPQTKPGPQLKVKKERQEIINDLTYHEACVVCMNQLRSYVYLPCAHFLMCNRCVGLFKACPVCQTQIVQKVQIRWGADLPNSKKPK